MQNDRPVRSGNCTLITCVISKLTFMSITIDELQVYWCNNKKYYDY